MRILLLCDDWSGHANTIHDHINAFRRLSRHDVRTFNPVGMRDSIALDLEEFDAVVIHYSIIVSHQRYLSEPFREKLRRYRGLKAQYIQDEYRWVDRITAAMRDLGIGVLFTLVDEPSASIIYDARLPGVRRVHTLTGYVPDELARRPWRPLHERTIDVGYRGRDIPYWIGRLSREKVDVGRGFLDRAPRYGLKVDIAWGEKDRIYGEQWIDFVSSCRATLCSESGASITDFDGSAERGVVEYLKSHPGADFEEVHRAVLAPYEGNAPMAVVSPRVFEAAALGTALVMFPGRYSGTVQPDEHYIPLEKDFSNMDQVVEKLRDDAFIAALTERAADHLVRSARWSFREMIRQFDQVMDEEARPSARRRATSLGHTLAVVERMVRVPPPTVRVMRAVVGAAGAVRGRQFARRGEIESGALLVKGGMAVRAVLGDPALRALYRTGRRLGYSRSALLAELLELSLMLRAASGQLPSRERFEVASVFDSARGALDVVSVPVGSGHLASVAGEPVESVEWDHSAFGGIVELVRPAVSVGVGTNGVRKYEMLARAGKRDPQLLRRVLAPVMGSQARETVPVA